MAKVYQPLLSGKASGKIGDIITYRCGRQALLVPGKSKTTPTAKQTSQRIIFAGAAEAWKRDLNKEQQKKWQDLADFARQFDYNINFLGKDVVVHWEIGKKNYNRCITTFYQNGYRYFLSAFMKWGPNGWDTYPEPPAVSRAV
jgi:hypothetical protein